MFSVLNTGSIKSEVVGTLARLQLATEGGAVPQPARQLPEREFEFKHEEFHGLATSEEPAGPPPGGGREHEQPYVREARKVGRNEPCPCGSGKKFKHCHGKAS